MRAQPVDVAVAFALIGLAVGSIGGYVATIDGRTSWSGFWPVYLSYLVVAGVLGAASPAMAWLAGLMMMPAHWLLVLANGSAPHTSTMGVGHIMSLIASIPPALSGYYVSKLCRPRSLD
jgi:hypothetical protein